MKMEILTIFFLMILSVSCSQESESFLSNINKYEYSNGVTNSKETVLYYDENLLIRQVETETFNDNTKIELIEYKYDDKGRVIESVHSDLDGFMTNLVLFESFEYGLDNNLTAEFFYPLNVSPGKAVYHTYHYNDDGMLDKSAELLLSEGTEGTLQTEQSEITIYRYDVIGNIIHESVFLSNSNFNGLASETEYLYD